MQCLALVDAIMDSALELLQMAKVFFNITKLQLVISYQHKNRWKASVALLRSQITSTRTNMVPSP